MVVTLEQLSAAVPRNEWLAAAQARVAARPAAVGALLPAVGRQCGRAPLLADTVRAALPIQRSAAQDAALAQWRTDDAARTLLLAALPLRGAALAEELRALYRFGDSDEKRAVLLALPLLHVGDECVDLLGDALRTNDTRLVSAALGPYAAHLDDAAWRQAVLKCVFMGIPLSIVDDLEGRADGELAVMLSGLAEERHAAGRTVPADATALLHQLTSPQLRTGRDLRAL